MNYQVLIETDSALEVLDVDGSGNYIIGNELVGELAVLEPWWPQNVCPDGGMMMHGTRVFKHRKINHTHLSIESNDPLTLLESLIASYDLDWVVHGMYSTQEHPLTDANGDPLLDTDGIQLVGSVIEKAFDVSFLDYLADENGQRPTAPKPLHQFAGLVQMVVPA